MPTLKDLTCSVEIGKYDQKLTEFQLQYEDAFAVCHIVVPEEPTTFSIHLTSQGFIAESILAMIWIDGVYQCNKLHTNLRPPTPEDPRGKQLNLRMRQMIRPTGEDGVFTGSQWVFDRVQIGDSNDGHKLRSSVQESLSTIDVVVLRAIPNTPNWTDQPAYKGRSDNVKPDAKPESKADTNKKASDAGSIMGLAGFFDGPGDLPTYTFPPFQVPNEYREPVTEVTDKDFSEAGAVRGTVWMSEQDLIEFRDFQRWKKVPREQHRQRSEQSGLLNALNDLTVEPRQQSPRSYVSPAIQVRHESGPGRPVMGMSPMPGTVEQQIWRGELLASHPPTSAGSFQSQRGPLVGVLQWRANAPEDQRSHVSIDTQRWGHGASRHGGQENQSQQIFHDQVHTRQPTREAGGWDGNNSNNNGWDSSSAQQPNGNWDNSNDQGTWDAAKGDNPGWNLSGGAQGNDWGSVNNQDKSPSGDQHKGNKGGREQGNNAWATGDDNAKDTNTKNNDAQWNNDATKSQKEATWDTQNDAKFDHNGEWKTQEDSKPANGDERGAKTSNDDGWNTGGNNASSTPTNIKDSKGTGWDTGSNHNLAASAKSVDAKKPEVKRTLTFEQSLYEAPPIPKLDSSQSSDSRPSIPLTVPRDCNAVSRDHADSYTRAGDFAPYVHKTRRAYYRDSPQRPYAHFRFYYRTKAGMEKLLPGVDLEQKEDEADMKKRFARMSKGDLEVELLKALGFGDEKKRVKATAGGDQNNSVAKADGDDGSQGGWG